MGKKSKYLLISELQEKLKQRDFYKEDKTGISIKDQSKITEYHKASIISMVCPQLRNRLIKKRLLSEFNRILLIDKDRLETLYDLSINNYCIDSYDLMSLPWDQSEKGVSFWYTFLYIAFFKK